MSKPCHVQSIIQSNCKNDVAYYLFIINTIQTDEDANFRVAYNRILEVNTNSVQTIPSMFADLIRYSYTLR